MCSEMANKISGIAIGFVLAIGLSVVGLSVGCHDPAKPNPASMASQTVVSTSKHRTAMATNPEVIENERRMVENKIGVHKIYDESGVFCGFDVPQESRITDDFVVTMISGYRLDITRLELDAKDLSYSLDVLPKLENLKYIKVYSAPPNSKGLEELVQRGVTVELVER